MQLHYFSFLLSSIFIVLQLTACNVNDSGSATDADAINVEELFELCSDVTDSHKVTLYTLNPVRTAYTPVYVDIREAGSDAVVEQAELTITPIMDMGEHVHSAPVWQPGSTRNPDTGLFETAIIPTMPGGSMGGWFMEWSIDGEEGGGDACTFDVDDAPNVQVFTAADDERYILTWIRPEVPETGGNELVLTLHRRATMMDFPTVVDAQLEVRPWMGSMDHGSEGNEHPLHTSDGFYEGTVAFNMSGDWEVYITLLDGSEELYEAEFEWTVK